MLGPRINEADTVSAAWCGHIQTMSTNELDALIAKARKNADAARDAAVAKVKEANKALDAGDRIPVLVVRNHARAAAFVEQGKAFAEALTGGRLHVKSVGKVLKNGDVNIRIGLPGASLESKVEAYRNARARRKAEREAKKAAKPSAVDALSKIAA